MVETLLGDQHECTRQTAARLVQLYRAWSKPEEAVEFDALNAKPAGT